MGLWILSGWLIGALLATYVGFDRGRWLEGMLLGICAGPLGVFAAGFLQPSIAVVVQREYALLYELDLRRQQEAKEAAEKRKRQQELQALVSAVETQGGVRELGLAEGLEQLAHDLEGAAGGEKTLDNRLRSWSTWLKDHAYDVRRSQRA